ncbi:MAG: alpha/beta hydrolase [Candidatus Woesebacteria bacterium]|nr:MAG: alpha/beta hydrolase [Candidatus Woesebacteria bacterium]
MAKVAGIIVAILIILIGWISIKNGTIKNINSVIPNIQTQLSDYVIPSEPLSIKFMRAQNYPGSDIKIEETLAPGSNYSRHIVSYYSDGLKEFALMTIPQSPKPQNGFPVIIFNHGYIIPEKYTPDGNYISYVDALSKAGYIVFKPDYRGNGKSEGIPGSSYFSPNYAIDVLNAIGSVKKFVAADPGRVGIWGHSMGANIVIRVSEISPEIKATVIWGGVVGSYSDILYNWQNRVTYKPNAEDLYLRNLGSQDLLSKNGTPSQNSAFWNSIDPTTNLNFIKAPIQIHVGLADPQVPPDFSKNLFNKLSDQKKLVEYFEYSGANHDINQSFGLAMQRTIEFFDRYLKQPEF